MHLRTMMKGLSRSVAKDDGGMRPFRMLRPVQRVEARSPVAKINRSNGSPAKSVTNALVTASCSVKQTLSTLYDRLPGGARQSGDTWVGGSAPLGEDGGLAKACPAGMLPKFEEYSAERILKYCDDHAHHLPTGEDMAMVQRLYEIAFFQHDIAEESSKKALEWVEVLRVK